jgi:hypothetical protein
MSERLDDDLEGRIRRALDEKAEGLDAATLSRLRQARERALARRPGTPGWLAWPGGGAARWAGALAGVALLVVGWTVWRQATERALPVAGDDLEVLASAEDLRLYQELDFYLWLERERKGALADEVEDRT